MSTVDLTAELLGAVLPEPFVVAPMAFHALAHPDGERATIAGAGSADAPPCCRPARDLIHALARRAAAAGAAAVVLTVDTPYVGLKGEVGADLAPVLAVAGAARLTDLGPDMVCRLRGPQPW